MFLLLLLFTTMPALAETKVLTGLDVLEKDNFKQLQGKKVGLITNQTALDNHGEYILDIFARQKQFQLRAIFTPEHGLRGKEDKEFIPSETYGENIPVYSLYGEVKKPAPEMLKGLDVLVYDIQDIGTRYYTFITTMAYAMEAAAENHVDFMVLDRPDPITGSIVEGEVLEPANKSFTGYFPVPVRYGMTAGELAGYYKGEAHLNLNLEIIRMENWKRQMWFDNTGLKWVNPSPNMRSVEAAAVYPGLGMLEAVNLSVGRGTETPFTVYGAPWLDNELITRELNQKHFPGLKFEPISFTPDSSVYAHQKNYGFRVVITDRDRVRSVEPMIYALYFIKQCHPDKLKYNKMVIRSFGSALVNEMLDGKYTPAQVITMINRHIKEFMPIREKYLVY